jgi:P-type Ca2+ transporter type 2C
MPPDRQSVTTEPEADAPPWHAMEAAEAASRLETDVAAGLGRDEAARRLERYGPNELVAADVTRWYTVLLRQFIDVLIFILLAAAVISVAIGEAADAIAILIIVVLNGILGFVQEWRAEKAIEALQSMLAPTCSVVREGTEQEVPAADLVPGDLVSLAIGDRVPADLRLVHSTNLEADESSLTGESVPVDKAVAAVAVESPLAERPPMAWMGTTITNGRARGIVTATGMGTEFGRIAELTAGVEREHTPLQRRLDQLGKRLGVFAVGVSALVAVAGIVAGKDVGDMFLTGVSLAVAVVPEGLPAVVTITLALGIRTMVHKKALLRRLQAAETLGSATVICTDKTGTLTENQMTVQAVHLPAGPLTVTGVGYAPHGEFRDGDAVVDPADRPDLVAALEAGLRCSHATIERTEDDWRAIGEPTEAALVTAAHKAGLTRPSGEVDVTEFSFNSTRKRMTMVHHLPDGDVAYVKGAPEVILRRCTRIADPTERAITDADVERVTGAYKDMARDGLRTLAIARRRLDGPVPMREDDVEQDLTLLAVVGILDPPRPEVTNAVRMAGRAGIRVVMITGDAPETAVAIARRVGLRAERWVTGSELDDMDDAAVRTALAAGAVFARTTPEDKLRIVTLLQEDGEIAAMTGDGVNDAPALKKADIGIAMGIRGTDVAKGASDMILTDDNFASIVSAVEEGRRQYDNIQKFVRYLLSSNTGEIVAILVNILVGGPLILLPVQILWMNLITDGVTAVALGVEPAEKGIMSRPPRPARSAILEREGLTRIALLGLYMGLATFFVFQFRLDGTDHGEHVAQTMAFTTLVLAEKMNVFNYRTLRAPMSRVGWFSNRWLIAGWVSMVTLQILAVYVPPLQHLLSTVPLTPADWVIIVALAVPIFIITESIKVAAWRRSGGDDEE